MYYKLIHSIELEIEGRGDFISPEDNCEGDSCSMKGEKGDTGAQVLYYKQVCYR